MRRITRCLAWLLCAAPLATAQQQDIFPTLSGQTLVEALAAEFAPGTVFGYDRARDSLFAAVYYEDGGEGQPGIVRCVYTGWPISIDLASGVAPRTQAHDQGVNTEHTWPQSYGAGSGHPRSNLHHLYPTRADANTSRSNYPFAELANAVVSRWWYLDQNQAEPPPPPHDLWSRTATSLPAFEPRDDHKGRVARAMFYFYTIYHEAAESVDPFYFDIQMDVLRAWHQAFPPDSLEHVRNHLIASYQDGRLNPFIADTTLIRRAYFAEPSDGEIFDAIYTFDGTTGCDNEVAEVAAQPDGASFSSFSRTGVVCHQGTDVFNSRDWAEGSVPDAERFVEFSVMAESGRQLEFEFPNRITFISRRSETGPSSAEVRYSVDGGNFLPLESWEMAGAGNVTNMFYIPETSGATSIAFRFYAWDAATALGTLRFDNVRLTGRTTSPPITTAPDPGRASMAIEGVYPNPSRGPVTISFSLATPTRVRLAAYDVLGRRIAVIGDAAMEAGEHEVEWSPHGLAGGVYVLRLEAEGQAAARRVVLTR